MTNDDPTKNGVRVQRGHRVKTVTLTPVGRMVVWTGWRSWTDVQDSRTSRDSTVRHLRRRGPRTSSSVGSSSVLVLPKENTPLPIFSPTGKFDDPLETGITLT